MPSRKQLGRRGFLAAGAALGATGVMSNPKAHAQERMLRAAQHPSKLCSDLDVLICGGGPAGIGAAIASAKMGAKTLLIENHAFFGGTATFSLGMPINQMRPESKPRSFVHELIIEEVLKYGDKAGLIGLHQLSVNVDYMKVGVLDALDKVGCGYLVHTQAVDTIVENNRVTGVLVGTKEGLKTITAKTVVDCTGDGDIAYFAGAETMIATGELSPMTMHLTVGGFDMEAARKVSIKEVATQGKEKYPLIPNHWPMEENPSLLSYFINHPGTRDYKEFDGTDADDLTEAEAFGRRQAVQMVAAMREFGGEAMKDIELLQTGPQIGVRETRRIKGEYIVTEADMRKGATFDDVITCKFGRLDIGFVKNEKIPSFDVPYRALVPEKVDGLLFAGRCMSADHIAVNGCKDMGNNFAMGHAAGVASAICADKNMMPREVNVKEVQDVLASHGVDLSRGGEVQRVSPIVFNRGMVGKTMPPKKERKKK